MLEYVPTTMHMLEAIDHKDITIEKSGYQIKRTTLPAKILVKQGILVELIAGNLDIEDGLVNGTNRIF